MTVEIFNLSGSISKLADGVTVNDSGKINFYEPGPSSTTRKAAYSDKDLSSELLNPLPLPGSGRIPTAWLNGDYRIVITDKDDVTLYDTPNYNPAGTAVGVAWSAATVYPINSIVLHGGEYYRSLKNNNLAKTPASSSSAWGLLALTEVYNPLKKYGVGEAAIFSGKLYVSVATDNIDNTPGTDVTKWEAAVDLSALPLFNADTVSFIPFVNSTGVTRKAAPSDINLSLFNDDVTQFKSVSSTESKSSDTVLADSPALSAFSLPSGSIYEMYGLLIFDSSSATPDANYRMNISAGVPGYWRQTNSHTSGTSGAAPAAFVTSTGTTTATLDGTNHTYVEMRAIISPSSDITCALQWAQDTSDATATELLAGSYIKFFKVA